MPIGALLSTTNRGCRGRWNMTETVFVTGAGGFLGGTIVEALFFGGLYNVRAGIVRWSSAPRIARLPVQIVQCDILEPAQLGSALAGVDYVIHCAVGDERVTIEGTRNLMRSAAKAGVKRIVNISTISVYGQAIGEIGETTPLKPVGNYGIHKAAAELVCRDAEIGTVILRPTIIYGPFSSRWTTLFAMRLKSGWKHLGSLGEGACNLVHSHDVARFAIAALHKDVAGETFNINGPEIITWNEYLDRFNQHLGLPPLRGQAAGRTQIAANVASVFKATGKYALKHYKPQLRWVSQKSSKLRDVMERSESSMRLAVNPDELSLFGLRAHYRMDKAEQAFGFRSEIGVDAGLALAVKWLKHVGGP
jgi:nucleoside-diphosphate-sugar epimerase